MYLVNVVVFIAYHNRCLECALKIEFVAIIRLYYEVIIFSKVVYKPVPLCKIYWELSSKGLFNIK